jgi:hypothetical protein
MGSSKKMTVGYRYFFTMQMGLGRGPINELVEIRVGGKLAWYGSATESGSYAIEAPMLFGGDKSEGGIQGTFDLCMGEKTQGQNARVVALHGPLVSALRGVCTMVYDGMICAMNPYPKEWKMRVRRTTAGWDNEEPWYPERADIFFIDNVTVLDTPTVDPGFIGDPGDYTSEAWAAIYNAAILSMQEDAQLRRRIVRSMNPAHMLVEIATNREWGRGMPYEQIDLETYRVAADNLYCEGFGMCMRWNRQGGLDEVVAEIISTIGGFQYVSRTTGLLTLRLAREDYVVAELPVFTRTTGILSIESAETAGAEAGFNEVVVKYKSSLTGEAASVRYQNLGSIMSDGGVNSTTTEYMGIADRNIAVRVAARDVKSNTADLHRLKITLDRRGYPLEPGVPFVVSDAETGIGQMVMRSITITNEDFNTGTITLTCMTDVFGLPATVYVGPGEPPVDLPSSAPALPKDQRLIEVAYRNVYQNTDKANFDILTDDVAFVGSVAVQPNVSNPRYDLIYKADAEADYNPDDEVPGEWTDYGVLPTTIAPLDTIIDFVDFRMDGVTVGQMALIDDEEVEVVAVDTATGLITIARGCLDTVPTSHAIGTRVWFYETGETAATREFTMADVVDGKILSNSVTDRLSPGLAQELSITMVGRFGKPYPPGKVQLEGEDIFLVQSIAPGDTLTWARRNRITQADVVQDFHVADISPEAGQTVTINVYRVDTDALLETHTGVTGTSQVLSPGYTGAMRLEMFSVRDGLESHQKYEVFIGSDTPYMSLITGENMTTVSGIFLTEGA